MLEKLPVSDASDRRARRARAPIGRLVIALVLGMTVAGCTIPFGNGGRPPDRSPEETRRDQNRLYLDEQERMERQRVFDRVGPSDR